MLAGAAAGLPTVGTPGPPPRQPEYQQLSAGASVPSTPLTAVTPNSHDAVGRLRRSPCGHNGDGGSGSAKEGSLEAAAVAAAASPATPSPAARESAARSPVKALMAAASLGEHARYSQVRAVLLTLALAALGLAVTRAAHSLAAPQVDVWLHSRSSAAGASSQRCRELASGEEGGSGGSTRHLPASIVQRRTNLERRNMFGPLDEEPPAPRPAYLLAMAVGIAQRANVDATVRKFLGCNTTVLLFHYDGAVDEWAELPWSAAAVHVAVTGQGKWWYAKRFLHPDVVDAYDYVFVWDEDLGVDHFDVAQYLAIVRREGLEISQPSLDEAGSAEVHHHLTARRLDRQPRGFHRGMVKRKGRKPCTVESRGPPCAGWVEVMAPVFSRDAWRCVWHLIQNDLVHGWGLDFKLGYCTKKPRHEAIGVVDEQYVVHRGLPTLGSSKEDMSEPPANRRDMIRNRSRSELREFVMRWNSAASNDTCWVDRYA